MFQSLEISLEQEVRCLVYGRLELHISEYESRLFNDSVRFGAVRVCDGHGNMTLTWCLKNAEQGIEILKKVHEALAEKASLKSTEGRDVG
jgi:hypothetical protein